MIDLHYWTTPNVPMRRPIRSTPSRSCPQSQNQSCSAKLRRLLQVRSYAQFLSCATVTSLHDITEPIRRHFGDAWYFLIHACNAEEPRP